MYLLIRVMYIYHSEGVFFSLFFFSWGDGVWVFFGRSGKNGFGLLG